MEKLCKIRDIQRAVMQFEAQFEKLYGVCLNEGMALCSLFKSDKLTSGEIGELLGLTSSNTSKVIDKIEKKGYVNRIPGKNDKRQMYFTLSDAGQKLISSIKCEDIEMSDFLSELVDKSIN